MPVSGVELLHSLLAHSLNDHKREPPTIFSVRGSDVKLLLLVANQLPASDAIAEVVIGQQYRASGYVQ